MDARWEPSFVAVGALLGEPHDSVAAALGEGRAHANELLHMLQSPHLDRAVRARAIARVVAEIAMGLDSMRIA